jgi:hypothetical protein
MTNRNHTIPDPTTAPDYDYEALQLTWKEAHNRLTNAAKYKTELETLAGYIATAQAEEAKKREEYNAALGTGNAMRQQVLDLCQQRGIDPPAVPEAAAPPVLPAADQVVAMVPECNHLECPGCVACGCHTAVARQMAAVTAPDGGEGS